jgi:hypothetical protein
MYVVGATVLSDFWQDHPATEAALRALHALLADASGDELTGRLDGALVVEGGETSVDLANTRVWLDINAPAQVVRIARIEAREGD